jgi:AraC-like DNA-binding protein
MSVHPRPVDSFASIITGEEERAVTGSPIDVCDNNLTPQQPCLSSLPSYQEQLIRWNPYSRKNYALCYQFETDDEKSVIQIVPDGCVNLLFRCATANPTALISGVHVVSRKQVLEAHSLYFGFKPYCAAGFELARSSWAELINQTVPLQDLIGPAGQIMDELCAAHTFSARIEAIRSFTSEHVIDSAYVPDLAEFMEQELCVTHGNVSIATISSDAHYSSRYCRERFKEACGISQKSYASIMRFQNTIRMLTNNESKRKFDLADIVIENGYFDQSHLNREFRRFTNSSPRRFFQTLESD